MKIFEVSGQIYILPFVKITHSRYLNGDLELIIGWLKWGLIIKL